MSHFEIYILNFNGAGFLPACLDSLKNINTAKHSYIVNVVDNNSTDNSKQLVTQMYPWVNYIELGFNHGFSRGNNLGVKFRRQKLKESGKKADIHVFLNNDTQVSSDWLMAAAEQFEKQPQVGIIGSKSIFHDRFAVLHIESSPTFNPSHSGSLDQRDLGVFLGNLSGENIWTNQRSKYKDAYAAEAHGRWLQKQSKIYVAIQDSSKPARLKLTFQHSNPESEIVSCKVTVSNCSELDQQVTVSRSSACSLELSFNPEHYCDVIQNAGSFVRPNWEAGDRGFLEIDQAQFDKTETVDSICGVSMFIRDRLFATLGGFDEHYFAYYEDTDLSLRARILGEQCLYVADSQLRHVHCGSGVEYSDYFNNNVAYSHLIFASKFMNSQAWGEKLSEVKRQAMQQLDQFELDRDLTRKPQLRAYCRYLKSWPRFMKNRIYQWHYNPGQRLFCGANAVTATTLSSPVS